MPYKNNNNDITKQAPNISSKKKKQKPISVYHICANMPLERETPLAQQFTIITSCTITYIYFPAFQTVSSLKSYLHKLDDDNGQPKLTAGIVISWATLTPGGAASHGLSRATAHVCAVTAVRSEISGPEIAGWSPSRVHPDAARIWTEFPTLIWSFFCLLLAGLLLAALIHEMVCDGDSDEIDGWVVL